MSAPVMDDGKLPLPGVTLACIDCVNVSLALQAMRRSMAQCRFARAVLFTSQPLATQADIEVVAIAPITSKRGYSVFLVKEMPRHLDSDHVLVMQWDGYVINTAAWDPAFLDCDYIGAPWPADLSPVPVGNGGFSLRSRRLLDTLTADSFPEERIVHEDQAICVTFRETLERDHGIRFASAELAARFSHETTRDGQPTFGFHGLQNVWMYWDAADIDRFVHEISRGVLKHPEATWLARHLNEAGRYPECAQVAGAALVEQSGNSELLDILATLRDRSKPHDYMARSEQRFFMGMLKRNLPDCFRSVRALDITLAGPTRGSVREWFDADCQLTTLTHADGEGPEVYAAQSGSFDTLVSCETLEHLPNWADVLRNALRLLKPGGLMAVSCAGLGRRQHQTPRHPAPDGSQIGTYYRNLAAAELAACADLSRHFAAHWLVEDRIAHDLYLVGIGHDAPASRIATLTRLMSDLQFLAMRRQVFGLY